MARPSGFEPETHALEGRCSIQLSYGRNNFALIKFRLTHLINNFWSEWRDLNPRPPGPKPDTLPSCATLRKMCNYTLIASLVNP